MFVDKKRGTMQVVLLFLSAIIASFLFLRLGQSQSIITSKTQSITPILNNPQTTYILVTEVIDGDTIKIASGQHVRLIGIDTPELHHPKKPVECFAKEAQKELQKLVLGRKVRLEKDVSEVDRYKRLLRYVYVDKVFVNEVLVTNGFAKAVTFPPDIMYTDLFRKAEENARLQNRGLWKICQ